MRELPSAADLLPNSRLFGPLRHGSVRRVDLDQARVHDQCGFFAEQSHDGRGHRDLRLDLRRADREIEVELVKRQTMNQMPLPLGLEARDIVGAERGVDFPIPGKDRVEEFLVEGKEFGFERSWHVFQDCEKTKQTLAAQLNQIIC